MCCGQTNISLRCLDHTKLLGDTEQKKDGGMVLDGR